MVANSDLTKKLAEKLLKQHKNFNTALPRQSNVHSFAERTLKLLFPHFSEQSCSNTYEIMHELDQANTTLKAVLHPLSELLTESVDKLSESFFASLDSLQVLLNKDANAIYAGDPAAQSVDEVIFSYPGFLAIALYRIAHKFYQMQVPVFPRMLTEYAHRQTGVDIHPGADIDEAFCIDHATSVVIGETTKIGKNVKIYQGVTLGALSVDKDQANKKRHPTIEDHVVIYANATILGGNTVIGHNSVIGGNVWLTTSVPPHTKVYNKHRTDVQSAKE